MKELINLYTRRLGLFSLCVFLSLMLVALCVVCVAAVRWNSNRKGHKYPGNGVKH